MSDNKIEVDIASILAALKLPGEAGVVAVANLLQAVVDGQPPEFKKQAWLDLMEFSKPWTPIWVEISKRSADFVQSILNAMDRIGK